jgi:hypothetical protein
MRPARVFVRKIKVGLTMQNTNTGITVAGHPLPTRPARSRAVDRPPDYGGEPRGTIQSTLWPVTAAM